MNVFNYRFVHSRSARGSNSRASALRHFMVYPSNTGILHTVPGLHSAAHPVYRGERRARLLRPPPRHSQTVLPLATLKKSRQSALHRGHLAMTVKEPPPAPNPPTAAAPITSNRNSEARRAYREVRTAIALLQQRWPAAFPEAPQPVRPLITGLVSPIAAALDWSHPYTRAALRTWKLRPAYCHAILTHPVRFDLEGNPTDQPVNEDTRTQAKARLAAVADRRRRLERRLNEGAVPPAAAPGPQQQQQEATARREPPPPSLPPRLLAE